MIGDQLCLRSTMYKISNDVENRIDLEIAGKLDSNEMRSALDELLSKSTGMRNGGMLYRVHDFNMPTLGAIRVKLFKLPTSLKLFKRVSRIAIVAEKKWLRQAAKIQNKLMPGLLIKAFKPEELVEAEAWLAEGSATASASA